MLGPCAASALVRMNHTCTVTCTGQVILRAFWGLDAPSTGHPPFLSQHSHPACMLPAATGFQQFDTWPGLEPPHVQMDSSAGVALPGAQCHLQHKLQGNTTFSLIIIKRAMVSAFPSDTRRCSKELPVV